MPVRRPGGGGLESSDGSPALALSQAAGFSEGFQVDLGR